MGGRGASGKSGGGGGGGFTASGHPIPKVGTLVLLGRGNATWEVESVNRTTAVIRSDGAFNRQQTREVPIEKLSWYGMPDKKKRK